MNLIERLRQAAAECSGWDVGLNPPLTEWSDLMDEAASELERMALPHKAEPMMLSPTTHAAHPTCMHCGDDIHSVPGGQGRTWVHTVTGAVAGTNHQYRTGPLAPGRTIVGGEPTGFVQPVHTPRAANQRPTS